MARPDRAVVVLAAAGLVLGLAFQGSRGLYETTEGRYAEAGREMLETGLWLEPQLDYRPHWTKPPVTYWAIAGGLAVLGENEWGARLANAVAFGLTGLVVAGIGRRLWDRSTGLIAGIVYLTSLFPFVAASILSTDTLLTLAEAVAVLAWTGVWRGPPEGRRRAVLAMWLAFGAAFMIKGPPGLLPLLPIAVFHVRARLPVRVFDPVAMAAGAVVGLWWYGLEAALHPGLLSYFVGDEIIARNVSDAFGRNPEWWAPFVIYLPVMLLAPGVWLADGIAAVRGEKRIRPGRMRFVLRDRQSPARFLALLVLLPLLVLSVSRSRLPLYVLPLYPAVALGIARAIALRRRQPVRHAMTIALPAALLLIGLKGLSAHYRSDSDMKRLAEQVRALSGESGRVGAYGESRLYGLQFHLGGELARIPRTVADAGAGLDAFLSDTAGSPDRPAVIVVRQGNAHRLEDELRTCGGATVRRSGSSGGWRLLELDRAWDRSCLPARTPASCAVIRQADSLRTCEYW